MSEEKSLEDELFDIYEKDNTIIGSLKEIYEKGLKEAFNKLECEEFDTCLRIEYEKSKAYKKALDDFRKRINDFLNDSSDFADFVVTDGAIDWVIDELKKGTEDDSNKQGD